MNRKFIPWVLLLHIFLLASCYSLPQPQTEISVVMHDNGFTPSSWRVPAGATITLHLTNLDPVRHDWTIIFRQTTTPTNTVDPANIYWQYSIAAGKSETVQFTAPAAAGNYQIVSSAFMADGMVGRLTVVRLDSLPK